MPIPISSKQCTEDEVEGLSNSNGIYEKKRIFFSSQDPRGEVDHVDIVLDHALFVSGTDIKFEDWKLSTPEMRKERLDSLIENEMRRHALQAGKKCKIF